MSKENRTTRSIRLKKEYTKWKEDNIVAKVGFFPIYKDFTKYMPHLSPGAISLFVYFGLHSTNQTGECFHSIETIADFFGKTTRTISNWVKELEMIRLVERFQMEVNSVSHTYLRPYPNHVLLSELEKKGDANGRDENKE